MKEGEKQSVSLLYYKCPYVTVQGSKDILPFGGTVNTICRHLKGMINPKIIKVLNLTWGIELWHCHPLPNILQHIFRA